jgi:hypothetical protein
MKDSSGLHDPAALPLGKETSLPIEQEAALVTDPVWAFWRKEKSFTLPVNEPRITNPQHSHHTDYTVPALHLTCRYQHIQVLSPHHISCAQLDPRT